MKKTYYAAFLLALIIPAFSFAQKIDCKKFRNGTFKTTIVGFGTAIIIRNGKIQKESIDNGITMTFEVVWLNDCTYTIKPQKEFIQKNKLSPNSLMTVTIIKTTDSSYFQTTTSNFSNKKMTSEMIRIKQ